MTKPFALEPSRDFHNVRWRSVQSKYVPMKNSSLSRFILVSLLLIVSVVFARGATINLIGNDGLGSSSFNSGLNWSGSQAPSGANDYNTAGFQMRTPGDGVTTYTFAGASLTFGD